MAWFRARAGALEQQGAARFPKNATLSCLSAKKEHKDFLLAQKLDCSRRPYLSLFRVMSEGQNALGWSLSVDTQTTEQQWLPEFQPCATHTVRVEEMQVL